MQNKRTLWALGVGLAALARAASPVLSDDEARPAVNGPLPGDVGLYAAELEAAKALTSPGYYPGLGAAEIADARRSGLFPAATFTGSMEGPNRVLSWRSQDTYQGLTYMVSRRPGELYVLGGDYPPPSGPVPPGPFVAKVDATTGGQLWRTYLDNANASGRWIGNANLNILDNGRIPVAWSNQIVLLDGDTGLILKHATIPTGRTPSSDANFKHLTIAPDRTLILKCQTRPTGSKEQGTMAIFRGLAAGLKQPSSHMVAMDPDTLQVLDELGLPEPSSSPHIIAVEDGRIAIYIPLDTGMMRCHWDPATKKLAVDEAWRARPMLPGQTTSTAAALLGEWVVIQTNGAGSTKKASSIALVHRKDSSRMETIFPFGELKAGEWSFAPPKATADPDTSMVYSADAGVGKVAGIRVDMPTGKMTVAFLADNRTTTFQPLIGPKERRVVLLTHMRLKDPGQPFQAAVFSGNYVEQLTWRDAVTGRLLAESEYFEALTINSLTPPGYGGRVYFPTAERFYVLQVLPKQP